MSVFPGLVGSVPRIGWRESEKTRRNRHNKKEIRHQANRQRPCISQCASFNYIIHHNNPRQGVRWSSDVFSSLARSIDRQQTQTDRGGGRATGPPPRDVTGLHPKGHHHLQCCHQRLREGRRLGASFEHTWPDATASCGKRLCHMQRCH